MAQGPALTRIEKYQLGNMIGEGSMGKVFRATNEEGHIAAIKVASATKDKDLIARFEREAACLKGLKGSPHIVQYIDDGTSYDVQYIVMELLEGTSLWKYLQSHGGRLSQTEALALFKQVCAGMIYAHERDILHRDLKPDNIFVVKGSDGKPFVKILDFGLAKDVTSNKAAHLTQPFVAMGTMVYMAPEQGEDARTVDKRADIFSLGCVLYRLIVGKDAYDQGCSFGVNYAVFPKPTDVTQNVWNTIIKAINPGREHRQRSVKEFWNQLEQVPPAPVSSLPLYPVAQLHPELQDQPTEVLPPKKTTQKVSSGLTTTISVMVIIAIFIGLVVGMTTLTDRLWDRDRNRPGPSIITTSEAPVQPPTATLWPEPTSLPVVPPTPSPRIEQLPPPIQQSPSAPRPRTSWPIGVSRNPDGSCCKIPNRTEISRARRQTICAFLRARHLVCPVNYDQ